MTAQRLERAEGVVKWFDPRKGYGFVLAPDGRDVFVHFSVIEGEGFRALRDGSTVIFDAERADKGWRATFVKAPEPDIVVQKRPNRARTPRQ